ncbi:MAG TPA: YdcF family protein [bacterium]|nr:YdcF family protein [bacterium]
MVKFGLIERRERWVLKGHGWFILIISIAAILYLILTTIHPFLSVNDPVEGDILVVEGWITDYALEKAISEFKAHNYNLLVTTSTPFSIGSHLSKYESSAEVAAATLKQLGFDEELIEVVSAPTVRKDRTYASALALKKWLLNSNMSVKSLNIYTLGIHARRSRLMFKKALNDKMAIGVIAADDLSFDSHNWWKSSRGVKQVISETIAYFYSRFFFYPKE